MELQLQDKKPSQPYGLQGTNHLIKVKGKVSGNLPTKVHMKKDKIYAWCSCGYSGNQVSLIFFTENFLYFLKILKI